MTTIHIFTITFAFTFITGSLFTISTRAYLTPHQQFQIKRIIENPNTPKTIQLKVKQIVFENYLPWVKQECNRFCETNPSLMTYVYYNSINKNVYKKTYKKEDLYEDAYVGFSKALKNFNGNCSTITNYAIPYIKHELYKGITIATKQKRYKDFLETKTVSAIEKTSEKVRETAENDQKEKIIKLITDQNILTPTQQQLMQIRYDLTTMKKKRTIKQVCEIMGFSHETYRKYHNKIIDIISKEFKKHSQHF